MKNQIEKSNNLLGDFKEIEAMYSRGFELIGDFENGKLIASKELNRIVRDLQAYNNIGTRYLSFLIDCKNDEFLSNKEIQNNNKTCLTIIDGLKEKFKNLNFLIRQDLLKTIVNIGEEIQNCLQEAKENKLIEVA